MKPNVYLHPLPTLKIQVGQDRELRLELNVALELAAPLFCDQSVRRSCFSPKTGYFWRVVVVLLRFREKLRNSAPHLA